MPGWPYYHTSMYYTPEYLNKVPLRGVVDFKTRARRKWKKGEHRTPRRSSCVWEPMYVEFAALVPLLLDLYSARMPSEVEGSVRGMGRCDVARGGS